MWDSVCLSRGLGDVYKRQDRQSKELRSQRKALQAEMATEQSEHQWPDEASNDDEDAAPDAEFARQRSTDLRLLAHIGAAGGNLIPVFDAWPSDLRRVDSDQLRLFFRTFALRLYMWDAYRRGEDQHDIPRLVREWNVEANFHMKSSNVGFRLPVSWARRCV